MNIFITCKELLKKKKFDDLFSYLDENDVSDLYINAGQPLKCKYVDGSYEVSDTEILDLRDIDAIQERFIFNDRNRAVYPGTLHRVSVILDRGITQATGITFRVAREGVSSVMLIADILKKPKTTLLVGKPGVGKTSYLRSIAEILSNVFNVVVVDKSNEIAGDGYIPHSVIGNATRMQVPVDKTQEDVIREAAENHNPDIIIVDEISDYKEAEAIREITQKGVIVFATIHGDSLEALVRNPVALKLLGSFSHAAIKDSTMTKRNLSQKIIVEQLYPSCFDRLVVLRGLEEAEIYYDVNTAIQQTLLNNTYKGEWRQLDEGGEYFKLGSEGLKN